MTLSRCAPSRLLVLKASYWSATGKGMHSKIYTSLLNQHSWLHNCTAINSMYNETGLFGVFTSAESQYASKAVDAVCGVLQVS